MCSALGHNAVYHQVNPPCHASLFVYVFIKKLFAYVLMSHYYYSVLKVLVRKNYFLLAISTF
jgi:hypothetical protein